ncbi:helix-turn-helix domain-containing protein [Cohnella sp. CFH 77786]|uniref:helix-turn-helix transcriptional regulator n=1 Tax=Cohnella sp. CFH 77786 TaxID=2662265 RepID=UPI001C60F657|nr:AraC family transcriptional regulator [Cohnella sp. CFH 77786]MBW5445274.1 helix-turn-helix domain-containing protein [Cohnella sp. CFH 77786]
MECVELKIPPLPQLVTVGHSWWRPGTIHFERRFQVFDLQFVARGSLHMTEEDAAYDLGDGGVLLLEPGLTHVGHRETAVDTELYWVHFVHAAPERRLPHDKINWPQPLLRGTDADLSPTEQFMYLPKFAHLDLRPLLPILDEMVQVHRELSIHNALRLQVLLGELLIRLQNTTRQYVRSRAYAVSEMVIGYLKERLTLPFDAAGMEKELHFRFDYLARCMKRFTGMSPLQYFHHLKVEKARQLLAQDRLSIREVAEYSGIPDVNYFCRLFRRKTGMTPNQYRSMLQGFV